MTDHERTLIDDAQDQLRGYHIGTQLDPNERAAVAAARLALDAITDLAHTCNHAGLTGEAVRSRIREAHGQLLDLIATIEAKT